MSTWTEAISTCGKNSYSKPISGSIYEFLAKTGALEFGHGSSGVAKSNAAVRFLTPLIERSWCDASVG